MVVSIDKNLTVDKKICSMGLTCDICAIYNHGMKGSDLCGGNEEPTTLGKTYKLE